MKMLRLSDTDYVNIDSLETITIDSKSAMDDANYVKFYFCNHSVWVSFPNLHPDAIQWCMDHGIDLPDSVTSKLDPLTKIAGMFESGELAQAIKKEQTENFNWLIESGDDQ